MIRYGYDSESKKYTGEVNCQIDPLESELAGHTIYLHPANSTDLEPLEPKEGFDVVYDEETHSWNYVETPKEPEVEPYVPSELEQLQSQLWQTKDKLDKSDYINEKINDAQNWGTEEEVIALKEKYKPVYLDRLEWRKTVNELEAKIAELEAAEAE